MRAQIGLGDPTGGIIVLLIFAGLAGLGLILCVAAIVFFFRKRGPRAAPPLLLALGLLLASPGLWFGWEMLVPETPREKSWDFSTGRDVARLGEERKAGSDYYLGNIRSTIRLPGGRQWSGHA